MFKVNTEKCIGCELCTKDCFVKDIEMVEGKAEIKNVRCFKCGHCIAVCPVAAISTDEYDMNDVVEYDKDSFTIDPDNLLNFIRFERTIRHFKNQDLENEKILKIIEAGRFTQTASNAQNVNYVVVKDSIQDVRRITLETLKAMGHYILENSTNPLYKRYAAMWIKMHDDFITNPDGEDNLFFKAPVLIMVTSEHALNAGLASANMKLMIDALGLGTVFSGFLVRAAEENPAIKEFLGIEKSQNLVACMVVGYPNVKYRRTTPRKKPNIIWK
ncbi:nitroreductase family protein [Cetobacterium sp. ZWU0022]|uniref:nitroreductase family protein n=1 Tax=Cetobacterium sp. ZWU0022 TaxID=1340502 RepID=UPI0006463B39|nr:nitroreductase family protein [Cetobacterium sp. ZWU0022]